MDIKASKLSSQLSDGHVLEEGAPDEFFGNPETERARDLLGSIRGY